MKADKSCHELAQRALIFQGRVETSSRWEELQDMIVLEKVLHTISVTSPPSRMSGRPGLHQEPSSMMTRGHCGADQTREDTMSRGDGTSLNPPPHQSLPLPNPPEDGTQHIIPGDRCRSKFNPIQVPHCYACHLLPGKTLPHEGGNG